jgi:hypothetical protein
MDALSEHLESLAGLGTLDSEGAFTLAPDQVWSRLRQALPNGLGALRFLLRWLHARGAEEISIDSQQGQDRLTVSAPIRGVAELPAPVQGAELDFSGTDIELARAAASLELLPGCSLTLAIDDKSTRYTRQIDQGKPDWSASPSSGRREIVATCVVAPWSLCRVWQQETAQKFRLSPLPIRWNGELLSQPYAFSCSVLAWRHLRRKEHGAVTMPVMAPPDAVLDFQAARYDNVDVVLGLRLGPAGGEPFHLLRLGESMPLPQARKELSGFSGVIRAAHFPVDLQGLQPVWGGELEATVASFKDEAVDMALQLYHLEPPLSQKQAQAAFPGLQSVLLHLLDSQRFTEGHLLAEWLRARLQGSPILQDFRSGYTFDKLCALLAEPAGHAQTAILRNKHAEQRVRESGEPEKADEALLIAARLEMRARKGRPVRLGGDLEARLAQLARRELHRGRFAESAAIHGMLAMAFASGSGERHQYLTEAARAEQRVGGRRYADLLAREGQRSGRRTRVPGASWLDS